MPNSKTRHGTLGLELYCGILIVVGLMHQVSRKPSSVTPSALREAPRYPNAGGMRLGVDHNNAAWARKFQVCPVGMREIVVPTSYFLALYCYWSGLIQSYPGWLFAVYAFKTTLALRPEFEDLPNHGRRFPLIGDSHSNRRWKGTGSWE